MFNDLSKNTGIFKNKHILLTDSESSDILFREDIIKNLVYHLTSTPPDNVTVYGPPGTGKTFISGKLCSIWSEKTGNLFACVNCAHSNTEYKVYHAVLSFLGVDTAFTGLPTSILKEKIVSALKKVDGYLLILLDEVDYLFYNKFSHANGVLYFLSRLNSLLERPKVAIWTISNDISFIDLLDPRVVSSLINERIYFPPYGRREVEHIIDSMVKEAFEENSFEDEALELIAQRVSLNGGDIRLAKKILCRAGELAEMEGCETVTWRHAERAYVEVEKDEVEAVVGGLSLHQRLVLLTCISEFLTKKKGEVITTGEIYSNYREIAFNAKVQPVTLRSVSTILGVLDQLGLIDAKITSRGRYGVSRILRGVHPLLLKEPQRVLRIQKQAEVKVKMKIGDAMRIISRNRKRLSEVKRKYSLTAQDIEEIARALAEKSFSVV